MSDNRKHVVDNRLCSVTVHVQYGETMDFHADTYLFVGKNESKDLYDEKLVDALNDCVRSGHT